MWKEKVTRLFNANNITIEKIEKSIVAHCPEGTAVLGNYVTGQEMNNNKIKTVEKEIRKESPLGFYYTKKVIEKIDESTGKKPTERHWYTVTFHHNGVYYILKFLIRYGENIVYQNEDSLRPWEIAEGDHALSDTMLKSLQSQVGNFFDLMEQYKIKFVKQATRSDKNYWEQGYRYWKESGTPISSVKNDVYGYLYGNKNGLRVMTDEQKILSHGFDLKTSFRKDKESK
jgi:hypothetical protein